MEKIYGTSVRQDGLYKIGRNKWELIYGFGKDKEEDETGWNWRQLFTSKPTDDEIKEILTEQINAEIDRKILTGFAWNGKPVWLSTENQFNYKAAYDMAEMTEGASLPVTFKLGENVDKSPVYHTFAELDDFRDFYKKAMAHVIATLNEGWREKDSILVHVWDG